MVGTLAALSAVPFIMVLGNSMLIPILPRMMAAMDVSLFQVGLLITAFSLPAGMVIPLTGFLSDRVGRKTVMVPALVVYGLGGLIAGFAALLLSRPYWVIFAGRIVQGIGAGGTYQLAMALTGDLFKNGKRAQALGILEASNGLGKVVSPLAGAAVALIIWFAPFFVYGVLSLPVALLVWLLVEEPLQSREKKSLARYGQTLSGIFRQKGIPLAAAYLAGMAVLFTLFGVLSFFSDTLEKRFNIMGFGAGLVIAVPVLVMAVTSFLAGTFLQQKLARLLKVSVIAGLALITSALLLAIPARGLVASLSTMVLIGLGTGLVLPSLNTLITSSAAMEERGLVTALYGTVRFFGVALGPPAFGWALTMGRAPMFLGNAAVTGAAAVLAFFFIKEKVMLPARLLKGAGAAKGSTAEAGQVEKHGSKSRRHQGPYRNAGQEGGPQNRSNDQAHDDLRVDFQDSYAAPAEVGGKGSPQDRGKASGGAYDRQQVARGYAPGYKGNHHRNDKEDEAHFNPVFTQVFQGKVQAEELQQDQHRR